MHWETVVLTRLGPIVKQCRETFQPNRLATPRFVITWARLSGLTFQSVPSFFSDPSNEKEFILLKIRIRIKIKKSFYSDDDDDDDPPV